MQLVINRQGRSLRKQPTFGDVITGFPAKWRLKNERRNSILMTRHYPHLGSASHWSCRLGNFIQPIRSTTQIWWRVISIEVPLSFLRRHLARKPVVVLPNVGCFSQANRAEDFGILNKLETSLSERELEVRITGLWVQRGNTTWPHSLPIGVI